MTKPVRLAREARDELLAAARYYAEVRPELRTDFLAAIDEAMERLVRMARHLGSPPGIDPALGVRRVFVQRFPFSLYFRRAADTVSRARGRPRAEAALLLARSAITAVASTSAVPRHVRAH